MVRACARAREHACVRACACVLCVGLSPVAFVICMGIFMCLVA